MAKTMTKPIPDTDPAAILAAAHEHLQRLRDEHRTLSDRLHQDEGLLTTLITKRAELHLRASRGESEALKAITELSRREVELTSEIRDGRGALTLLVDEITRAELSVEAAGLEVADLNADDLLARVLDLDRQFESHALALAPIVQARRKAVYAFAAAIKDQSGVLVGPERMQWMLDDLFALRPVLSSTKKLLVDAGGFLALEKHVFTGRLEMARRRRDAKGTP